MAAAALNAGLITPDTIVRLHGQVLDQPADVEGLDNPSGHGEVNLLKAITESCDVYFYNLGSLLYQQPSPVLQDGVRKFGFGQPTGIDLPGETNGSRVPDKYWKAETGKTAEDKIWKTGDEINLAIGQGDLLVTPMQMAVGSVRHRERRHAVGAPPGLRYHRRLGQHHPPVRRREARGRWASAPTSSPSSGRA